MFTKLPPVKRAVKKVVKSPITKPDHAYCVRCKMSRLMINQVKTLTKTNRPMIKGICNECSCGMNKFVKSTTIVTQQ